MVAPHDKNKRRTSKQSKLQTNCEPLSVLASTVVMTSLGFPPFILAPVATPTYALVESFSKLSMLSSSMPILSKESSPGSPPANVHSEVQTEAPRRSKTNTMNSALHAFSSSRTLHQVLGMREPKPFVTPPEMPPQLAEQFEAGLQQYEQLLAAGMFASIDTEGVQAVRPSQKSRTGLADILEEKESPTCEIPARSVSSGNGVGLRINVPKWTSGKQAVAVGERYAFSDSDDGAANDTSNEQTEHELDVDDHSLWRYGSSTTLAASVCSRPGSSESRSELSSAPAPSFPPRTSSLLPQKTVHSGQSVSDLLLRQANKKVLPPGLPTHPTHLTVSGNTRYPNEESDNLGLINLSRPRRAESMPILLPSDSIKQRSRSLEQTGSVSVPGDSGRKSDYSHRNNVVNFNSKPASLSVPQITVQAPSPKKTQISRKRAIPPDHNDLSPRISQCARRDSTVGFPTLPPDAEALWKFRFPENTHALLTILLTWSRTMWLLYHRLPDPKLFAIHPAFPYPVSPPLARQLLSVSFYDTSTEPHKEVRFLGPGDVASISYHEVDIFHDPRRHQQDPHPAFPLATLKHTLGLAPEPRNYTRFTTPLQRAKTGSGRWCYILLKAHERYADKTPPHMILAWPATATTTSSTCLHTLPPPTTFPAPPPAQLKRPFSLQNLGTVLRHPARCFNQTLRSASSISDLPPVDAGAGVQQGVTLQRTVLKLERAGGVPLVEGFRVDVGAFGAWSEACGRGRGKGDYVAGERWARGVRGAWFWVVASRVVL